MQRDVLVWVVQGRPLLDAGIASLREEQGGSTLAVVLQRAGDPEGLNITTKRKLETSAAFITSHTSGKDVAPLHLVRSHLCWQGAKRCHRLGPSAHAVTPPAVVYVEVGHVLARDALSVRRACLAWRLSIAQALRIRY